MRNLFESRSASEQLDRTWDAFVSGQPVQGDAFDPLLHALTETDDAPPPRAAFTGYLRQRLELSMPAATTSHSSSYVNGIGAQRADGIAPTFAASLEWSEEPSRVVRLWQRQPRWLRQTLEFSAATLAILLVAALLILLLRDDHAPSSDTTAGQPRMSVPYGSRTTLASPTSEVVTPADLLPRDGQLISLDEAIAKARQFIGDPSAELTETPSKNVPAGIYRLERRTLPLAVLDTIDVDMDTGEVVQADLPSRSLDQATPTSGSLMPESSADPINDDEARSLARQFAKSRFADFDALTERETTLFDAYPRNDHPFTTLTWQLHANDSEAWLPVYVKVSVDQVTGEVFWYQAIRREYIGSTIPNVDRAAAIAAVEAAMRDDPRFTGAQIIRVELLADGNAYLRWWLQVTTQGGTGYVASVDAWTGEIIYLGIGTFGP